MFAPLTNSSRPALRRALAILLLAEFAGGILLSLPHHSETTARVRVTPLIWPPLLPKETTPRKSLSANTQRPAAGQPGIREAAVAPVQQEREHVASTSAVPSPPTLSANFVPFAERGARSEDRFEFVVSVDADWLKVLAANHGSLAFCPLRPVQGTPVLMYDLATGQLRESAFPSAMVPRAVDSPSQIPGVPMADLLQRAGDYFGTTPRVFTVYPQDLLYAMQGKAESDLAARHVNPADVRQVTAHYLFGPAGYDVLIERFTP